MRLAGAVGRNSLGVYVMHVLVTIFVFAWFSTHSVAPWTGAGIFYPVVMTFAVVLCCLGLTVAIKSTAARFLLVPPWNTKPSNAAAPAAQRGKQPAAE